VGRGSEYRCHVEQCKEGFGNNLTLYDVQAVKIGNIPARCDSRRAFFVRTMHACMPFAL